MSEFTASNGITFDVFDGVVQWASGHPFKKVSQALREFFQHERDEELGRWRWPENPEYVVYPPRKGVHSHGRGALVIHEPTARMFDVWEVRSVWSALLDDVRAVADAYFAAHPEPKPWHDAKPGELWELTENGDKSDFIAIEADRHGVEFLNSHRRFACTFVGIDSARRIWPEVAK